MLFLEKRIKEALNRIGLPLTKFAKQVDIHEKTLHRILRENSTKTETIEKIAKALDMPTYYFFMTDDDIKRLEGNNIVVREFAAQINDLDQQNKDLVTTNKILTEMIASAVANHISAKKLTDFTSVTDKDRKIAEKLIEVKLKERADLMQAIADVNKKTRK